MVVVLLVCAGAVAVTGDATAQTTPPETDNSVVRIALGDDGSARWTVQIRTRLDTQERVAQYAAFRQEFERDPGRYLGPFRSRIRGVVAGASNATGREMRATEFEASAGVQEVPRRWGVVTYEFTWTNFARPANGTLVVGDAFEGGFFIAANDTLQIAAPSGYAFQTVAPAPDTREDGVVAWTGREDFADGRPRVVVAPAAGSGDDTPSAGVSAPGPGPAVPLAGVTLALVAVAAVVLYRRRGGGVTAADDSPEPRESEAATADDTADPEPAETAAGAPIKTDEELVLELLRDRGGRVRQAELAAELDWSASKASRVVGRLAEDGAVEKLRIGRENLVALSDEE